jgi:hypothetical protein
VLSLVTRTLIALLGGVLLGGVFLGLALVDLGLVSTLGGSLAFLHATLFSVEIGLVEDSTALDLRALHGRWSFGRHGEGLPKVGGDASCHGDGVVEKGCDRPIDGSEAILGLVTERLVLPENGLRNHRDHSLHTDITM